MKYRRRRGRDNDRTGQMTTAAELLRSVLDRRGVKRDLREHRLLTRWPEIAGARIAARTFPDGLDRGVLWVRVASSAWLHQLSFLKERLVEEANRVAGDPPVVKEIRFHLGNRRRIDPEDLLAPVTRIRRAEPRPRELPTPATGDRLEKIEREASGVEDAELRQAIVDIRRRLNL